MESVLTKVPRNTGMIHNKPFRSFIQHSDNELLIFGTDNFPQFPNRDGSILSRCNRALAVAGNQDLVVLRTELDRDYQDWLHANGLGTDHIVEYGAQSDEMTLSEMIVKNPDPILAVISKFGRAPVYVPWFSGRMEKVAANILGADLFGSSESLTRTYNDKVSFKHLCRQLGISTIEGDVFGVSPEKTENYFQFEKMIRRHLSKTHTVIVRGALGEAGMSLYKTAGDDIPELYRQIADTGEKVLIIEPFEDVIFSPNDQWIIGRAGNISHMGIREQVCEKGMVYIGTLKGKPYPQAVCEAISKASLKIVTHMSRSGYTGVVGIDYIVTANSAYPVENNARFNGSTYVGMIIENIENKLSSSIPYWKFLKLKTTPISFPELVTKLRPILYDNGKLNCVFPYDCKILPVSGNLGVIILATDIEQMHHLEKELKKLGIKR